MGYQKIRNTWSGIERYNLNGRDHDYNKNVIEKYEPRINLPWNQWLDCIRDSIDDAIEKLKPTTDIEIIPQDAWANKYDTGHFQEYHTHEVPYCNLSIVYLYDIPDDNDVGFRFWYDDHSKYKSRVSTYI